MPKYEIGQTILTECGCIGTLVSYSDKHIKLKITKTGKGCEYSLLNTYESFYDEEYTILTELGKAIYV